MLHHSISSGKRKNKEWFDFLGVSLPEGELSRGGYKWIEPVPLDIVNLAPDHFITTNGVTYPGRVRRGLIIYFLPGHSVLDFQNPAYARLILNAVVFKP